MPIYEYRCADCGHQKEFLQKISDAPIGTCPACGSASFSKMLTAAGFQLKGSGWYATDFKGGSKSPGKESAPEPSKPAADSSPSTPCGGACSCH